MPVSIRAEGQRNQLGSQIVLMRGPLPIYIKDPVTRLRFVKEAMDGLKESKQAVGAKVLADVQQPGAADGAGAGVARSSSRPVSSTC